MSDSKKLRMRFGLVGLLALALLGLLSLFNHLPNLFGSSEASRIQTSAAPNVTVATPPRGMSEKIGPLDEPTRIPAFLGDEASIDLTPGPGVKLVSNVKPLVKGAAAVAVAVAPPPPVQDSLSRMQQSLERIEKMMPKIETTLEEYRLLAKDARAAIPDLRDTNNALQKLIKDVNDAVPDARKVLKGAADAMPDVRALIKGTTETMQEVKNLSKSVNEAVPDARKLLKEANETMPLARDTLSEIKLAARNWRSVGERADKLIESNEQKLANIVTNTEKATASTDRAMTNVADTFNVENRNNVTTILRNLNKTSERGPSIADETELFLRQGRGTMKKVDETFDTLNRATKPGSSDTSGMLKNLAEGIERFNKVMGEVNELFRVIDRSDGTLRRFIADPALYNHVDDAALMVGRLLPRLDRALKDLEVFADKLARHPEALGLGGVVRPNSGIKEPPR